MRTFGTTLFAESVNESKENGRMGDGGSRIAEATGGCHFSSSLLHPRFVAKPPRPATFPRMERGLLLASTFCFLLGLAYTMYALGARHFRPSPFNLTAIFSGFVLQSAF